MVKPWISALAVFVLAAISSGPLAATAAGAPPTIEGESVSEVTPTNAVLEAQIDPGGLETGYRFHLEYGCGISPDEACPLYCLLEWEGCSRITSIPLPEGQLPPSSEVESVSLDLTEIGVSLEPHTKYRYWVEAVNSAGRAEGSKELFTTPASLPAPSGAPPTVESESVSAITKTNATLEAIVDSGGLPTEYEFHLVEAWKCEPFGCELPIHFTSLPGGKLPASASPQPVSLDLNSAGVYLHSPANFYEYWITATNSAGSAAGSAQTFAPLEEESGATEPPLPGGSSGIPPGEETGVSPPPPAGDAGQGSRQTMLCRRALREHHAKHHRHRRAGIGKACRWA